MKKFVLTALVASTVSLGACATDNAGDIAEGAAYGGAAGTAIAAVVPGVGLIEGAAIGAGIGGLAGAVIPGLGLLEGAVIGAAVGGVAGAIWADNDRDGRADGYMYNGQYYPGAPTTTMPAPTYTAPMSGERG